MSNPSLSPPPAGAPRLLLESRQAAEALAISERLLWSLTAPRGPIPCVRIGRAVRYDPADLQAWIARQKESAQNPLEAPPARDAGAGPVI